MDKLLQKAQQLKSDARQILSDLGMNKFFSIYGEVKLVGSITYRLMNWEDLDIDLVTKVFPTNELFWNTAKFLMRDEKTKSLMLVDNRTGLKEVNRPKSIYLGVKYVYKDTVEWKIDIRLLEQKEVQDLPDWMESLDKLNHNQKLAILAIKDKLKTNPNYHNSISSVDVYDAVVNQGVDSYEAFTKWLKS